MALSGERAGRGRSARPTTAVARWSRSRSTSRTSPCSTTSFPSWTALRSRTRSSVTTFPTRILIVSAFTDSGVVYQALETGAAGFVSKEARREQIVDAVLACARGENVVPPEIAAGLVSEIRLRKQDDRPALTQREHEILRLIAAGKSLPRDREGALPRPDDGEDACAAPVREARRLRPGRGRRERHAPRPDRVARAEHERAGLLARSSGRSRAVVAWLRLPAIALLALGEGLAHPNREETAFVVALVRLTPPGAPLCSPGCTSGRSSKRFGARGHRCRHRRDQRPRRALRRRVLALLGSRSSSFRSRSRSASARRSRRPLPS